MNSSYASLQDQNYSTKRRFLRFPVDRPIAVIQQWEGSPPLTISGRCRVLSEGGAGAIMTQQLRVGEVVSLEVAAGMRLYAAVRNLHGFTHGFEFVLVRDSQREALKRLCRSYLNGL
jgi:hypothetical protein